VTDNRRALLIVEDEPHIASGLRFNLEAEGHDVTIVDTGEAASGVGEPTTGENSADGVRRPNQPSSASAAIETAMLALVR